MQPSEYEIQREVEALRDIRRRSTAGGPGSLILDPDLPSGSSQPSSTAYWSPTDDSSSNSHEDDSDNSSSDPGDDPFHLFWVPARLHPEIAPQEFRAFLKEHARAPGDEGGMLGRSPSVGSVDLGRKKSMLSRQYKPTANDGIEEEKVVPLRRNRNSILGNPGPQLTINDLQKLEELAEEASESDDPTRLRSVLRRSLSLNVAPSALDQMDDMPDMGDDADAPIIVPRPGQILRRAARTKIRKSGQTGEGAHRFNARSRRKSVSRSATVHETTQGRTSSDLSSNDHGDVELSKPLRVRANSDIPEVPPLPRPESYSEETLIYDAYATDEPEDMEMPQITTAPEGVSVTEFGSISPPSSAAAPLEHPDPSVVELMQALSTTPVIPVLHHPQPQRAVLPPAQPPVVAAASASSSSPEPHTAVTPPIDVASQSRPSLQESTAYLPSSPTPSERREKEKDKKGLFGKWGSDKASKRSSKEREKEKEREREKEKEKEKEKESGFFGSLFGGKKKQDDAPPPIGLGGSGRETAAALLGASKSSKNYVPSPSPQLNGQYARYPIHVERAIYRLSHIKLANPRRPLYEQVLISNLMFWYLGVINKAQTQAQGAAGAQTQAANAPLQAEKEQAEREAKEREERERAEKERLEREQAEQKASQRRGSLTKAAPAGSPIPGARRAEMPVRGPQYEMQHREMEQQFGYGTPNGAAGRGGSPVNGAHSGFQNAAPSRAPANQASQYGVQLVQPKPQTANPNQRFYDGGASQVQPVVVSGTPQLPPGAMPPVAVEQTWITSAGSTQVGMARSHSSSPPPRAASPPSPSQSSTRRARSPPSNRYTPAQEKQPYSGRAPGRSLSATAAASPTINGKLKKGASAHAVVQNSHAHRTSEDEDVPLAMWQQRRK